VFPTDILFIFPSITRSVQIPVVPGTEDWASVVVSLYGKHDVPVCGSVWVDKNESTTDLEKPLLALTYSTRTVL
jgi:hypothetical protein